MNSPAPGRRDRQDLTLTRGQILEAVEDLTRDHGFPPSLREIGAAAGRSVSTAAYHMKALQAAGFVDRRPGQPRTAVSRYPERQICSAPLQAAGSALRREWVRVPLVGRVAAGRPIRAEEQHVGTVDLPRQLVGHGTLFMLTVTGDSMIGAAIADGDMVVIRQQEDAENGDIVAAQIEGAEAEATVKTLKRTGGHVWLMPQNPAYTPISGDKATILGKVVAVLRRI